MAIEPAQRLTELPDCLADFQQRFATNRRAHKLVKGWNRQVFLEASDTGALYTLLVDEGELHTIQRGPPPRPDDDFIVHLQAAEETLVEIFAGRYNPSTALLDGMLSVFSNERDKVKLEAIAMVIWGL